MIPNYLLIDIDVYGSFCERFQYLIVPSEAFLTGIILQDYVNSNFNLLKI